MLVAGDLGAEDPGEDARDHAEDDAGGRQRHAGALKQEAQDLVRRVSGEVNNALAGVNCASELM